MINYGTYSFSCLLAVVNFVLDIASGSGLPADFRVRFLLLGVELVSSSMVESARTNRRSGQESRLSLWPILLNSAFTMHSGIAQANPRGVCLRVPRAMCSGLLSFCSPRGQLSQGQSLSQASGNCPEEELIYDFPRCSHKGVINEFL